MNFRHPTSEQKMWPSKKKVRLETSYNAEIVVAQTTHIRQVLSELETTRETENASDASKR